MEQKLIEIIEKEIIMFKKNEFSLKNSTSIDNFLLLENDYSILYDNKVFVSYYSKIEKKVVFGFNNSNSIEYLIFDIYKVDENFNKISNFEWHDRFIFTFND